MKRSAALQGRLPSRLQALLHSQEATAITVLVIGMVLAVSVLCLWWTGSRHARQRLELAMVQQDIRQLKSDREQVQRKVEHARLAGRLYETAKAQGLYHAEWNERAINVKQVPMKRSSLNGLLRDLQANDVSALDLDLFEFSVRQASDGLFTPTSDAGSEIVVSMKGRLLFKTSLGAGPAAL